MSEVEHVAPPSLARIARVFLQIGATSFGGGVVAYLRGALVERERWFDDEGFLRILELSQTLPGLNSVNVAVLAGDELRGWRGALVGGLGMILPGLIVVTILGMAWGELQDLPVVGRALAGAAAAAVGLIVATTVQIGRRQLTDPVDLALVAVTAVAVGGLGVSLPWAVVGIGGASVLLHRPGSGRRPSERKDSASSRASA